MADKNLHSCALKGCLLPDDEQMVSCDKCKRWWHFICHGFDPDNFDTITPWFCEEEDCVFREDDIESRDQTGHRGSLSIADAADLPSEEDINMIVEAAAVAQAAVADRDKELLELRAELAEAKKLLEVSKVKEQFPSVSEPAVAATKLAKLQIIKQIQANHQALLNSSIAKSKEIPSQKQVPSTTNHSTPHQHERSFEPSFRDQDMASLLTILNRSNVQELPSFSGENKREWPYFEEVFKSTTIEGRYSSKENVARLRKALKGEAYQLVSDRLKYSADANAIMDSLRTMFGRYDVLVHDLTTDLLNLPKLSSRADPNLRVWAVKLNGFVADIKSMNREGDLRNGYVLTNLASRLGPGLYQEWQRTKSISTSDVTFEHFAEFLTGKLIDLPPELAKTSNFTAQKKSQSASTSKSSRVLVHSSASSGLCCKCQKHHTLMKCEEFLALSPVQRQAFVKEHHVCFSCLDPAKHFWKVCAKKRSCGVNGCNRRHHPLLHLSEDENNNILNSAAAPFVPQPHIHSSHVSADVNIIFKIVPIRIYGKDDLFVDTYAFLDDGSSLSMVEEELFNELGLDGHPEQLTLQWTKGVSRLEDSHRTSLAVSAVNGRKRYVLKNVYTIKHLGLASQSTDVEALQKAFPHLRGLPLSSLVNAEPKILLGLDQAKFLIGHGQRYGKDEEPHALKTLLGWIVYGKSAPSMQVSSVHQTAKPTMQLMFHDAIREEPELHDLVRRHFTTEDFGVMPPKGEVLSRETSRSLEIMESSLKLVDRQYEIGLLWDSDDVKLPDSYSMAYKRLIGLEKSLKKKPDLLEWQNNHFRELISKGYARVASREDLERDWPRVWYAPTFIIINPNKSPPKPRCVADVAAKVSGISLNSHLMKGPDNLVPLHAGIFKFRERRIAVNGDVREMFHRIRIKTEDQQCQRILWRDGDSTREPTIYIMQVMMFGPRCSPSCAQYVKNHHANLYKDEFPAAVDGLTKRTYVDDYFNSHNTVEEAISVTSDAIRICHSMNFDLVGLQSNSLEVLNNMPNGNVNAELVSINPNESDSFVSKVLGMYWHPSSDHFTYKLAYDDVLEEMLVEGAVITKRQMLKTVMKIFDPLGIVSLFIIRGRILLQEVWREGFDWDEAVSPRLRNLWLEFVTELIHIERLKISRRYVSWNPDDSQVSLVIFVDASEKAFASVAYFRFTRNEEVEVALVMAKAKVAPVKQLSIPRLELQAAVLGTRLAVTIKESHSIRIDETLFFSDSKTVLSWINCTNKLPAFVATRVGEILDTTSPRQWFHIRSNDNVADDGTKRFETPMGNQDTRWFKGPDFLNLPFEKWPVVPFKSESQLVDVDEKSVKSLHHILKPSSCYGAYDMLSSRFQAKWNFSVRAIAFLLRFKHLLQKKTIAKEPCVTPDEFRFAENWMFRKIQEEAFLSELTSLRTNGKVSASSSIFCLSPFLDEDGTLRMRSRAQKVNRSYASRNPAILPKNHPLVDLFIQYHHERNFHMGTATVISDIRESAWIISIRGAVERVRSRCFMCKRLKAKAVMPQMGQLPEARLAFDSRPFTHVGVDCFGPLFVKVGRSTVKRYGMIFTCLTFRAVQIELLNDLSLDQCYMAVRRFVINRVVTKYFYSDNGLNFVGTKNLLEKDIKEMESSLCEYSSKYQGILWRFIPAYSPWMGGAWERLIQSIKKSVNFVLKGLVPREDVLRNALMEAQSQINRRPLTHVPVDPEDPKPLTPNLMLFGEADQDITAPGIFYENDFCSKLYSRRSLHLMSELTKRWYAEYLPVITRRSKWFKETKPIENNDIVIVIEPNEIRSNWHLGRVVKVYPGPDGITRIADVKLANGAVKTKRSIGRLAVLDLKSSN
ncbi:uncharacterized protein LOC129912762 [Episyrphus balteatus]|uniref:uncharacterized protein LOC129912762 n=1 Tax=Episyrphus balteatus TaxID=286459 RepID=UPI002486635B|nr:uncharacterized protein LOC129912762 [Episyrphus balteatus]